VVARKSALIVVYAIFGLLPVAGASVAYLLKSQSPPLGLGPRIQYPSADMPQSVKQQFLGDRFSLITEVRKLPAPVLQAFTEGSSRRVMADPGRPFQATDVIYDSTLPIRRLIFAGVLGEKCFVHYEQGGRAHLYVLAFFDVTSEDRMKPIWRGGCRRPAANLEELRSWVADGNCQ
jgi:hypothetical protein